LTEAVPNDPAHTARAAAKFRRVTGSHTDGQTDRQTPNIGNIVDTAL